jgi:hypothetical protein
MGPTKAKIGQDVNARLVTKTMLRAGAIGLAVAALAGCSRDHESKGSLFPPTANHVSPPPVTVPQMPKGTFDEAAGHGERQAATSSRLAGNPAEARAHAEKAALFWPADLSAWDELAADCGLLKDLACQRYAAFFRAKVEFVATLPPRVAVLGFASLNAAGVVVKVGDYTYDQRTLDTALRLASFYDEQDQLREARIPASKPASPAAKAP